jgi:hypothetical protein
MILFLWFGLYPHCQQQGGMWSSLFTPSGHGNETQSRDFLCSFWKRLFPAGFMKMLQTDVELLTTFSSCSGEKGSEGSRFLATVLEHLIPALLV